MIDPKAEKKEMDWADDIPDPEEEQPEADEKAYRDGNVQHECWTAE